MKKETLEEVEKNCENLKGQAIMFLILLSAFVVFLLFRG